MKHFLRNNIDQRVRRRFVSAFLMGLTAVSARASELPTQMIYPPLDGDPIGLETSPPKQLVAHFFELPDDRRAQLHRLSWWTLIGRAHGARVTLDYAGIEGDDEVRYGGGRVDVRWTSRIGPVRGRGLAFDIAGNLPTGDEGLFPFSAKAPMIEARLRWSAFDAERLRTWIGYWGRRISPPSASVRQDPLVGFPSGSGFDLIVESRLPHLDVELVGRVPTGGQISDAPWIQGSFDLHLATDLRLRLGAILATSPASSRPIDHGFILGVVWVPRRAAEESDLD